MPEWGPSRLVLVPRAEARDRARSLAGPQQLLLKELQLPLASDEELGARFQQLGGEIRRGRDGGLMFPLRSPQPKGDAIIATDEDSPR